MTIRYRWTTFLKLVDESIRADGEEVENSPNSNSEGRKDEEGVKLTCLPEVAKQEMRELRELVYLLPCNNCGNTDDAKFSSVCDEADGSILCRYCEVCRGYFGVDDSMGLNELLQLLQSGLLMTTRCQCGNDDVEKYVFDEVQIGDGKSIVLKCTVCKNQTDVVDEDDIDVSSAADDVETSDTQEDALANLMLQMKKTKELKEQASCQCDSIDPSHYNVYLDMYGRLSKVECTNCHQTYTPVKDKQLYGDDNLDPMARTRITTMADLKPGDHIVFYRKTITQKSISVHFKTQTSSPLHTAYICKTSMNYITALNTFILNPFPTSYTQVHVQVQVQSSTETHTHVQVYPLVYAHVHVPQPDVCPQ